MKDFNKVDLKGRIHSFQLEEKEYEKGTAIVGTVTLEVNAEGTTVEARFFAYPTYNSGKTNSTYNILNDMLLGKYSTVVDDGENASWLSMSGSISSDYFAGRGGAKTTDDLTRSQKVRGSFLSTNPKHEYSNVWKCDFLIYRIEDIDADPEKGTARKVRVYGYTPDSYNERMSVFRFDALDAAAMNYMSSLQVSTTDPLYTSIKGEFKVVKTLQIKEGAFGDANETIEFNNTFWSIVWMPRNHYEFGTDITEEEYKVYCDGLEQYKMDVLKKANDAANEQETAGIVF